MKPLAHGEPLVKDIAIVAGDLAKADLNGNGNPVACPASTRFGYLFPELQDPRFLLPETPQMAQTLIDLAGTMSEAPDGTALDSKIPSAYTYFGQFITHDIAFERTTHVTELGAGTIPLKVGDIPNLENVRTPSLDLDSVYGPIFTPNGTCFAVPVNGAEMVIDHAIKHIPEMDVPREVKRPYTAKIGDPRNDANFITSQMHVAFLRAHNALTRKGSSFDQAQRALRQHFQWLVIADFLPRVVNAATREAIENRTLEVFNPADPVFMPIEFSAGAFRFAHSITRERYNYNASHDNELLSRLFLPNGSRYHHILEQWIIDWKRFLPESNPEGNNVARRIDTQLVPSLSRLIDENGKPKQLNLAAIDLLRGYLLRLPTGQALADKLGMPKMSASEIERVARNNLQQAVLRDSGLSGHTPLWFYILAEAVRFENGLCLGPVGSRLVASVLIGLISRSADSILHDPTWKGPTLGPTPGTFELKHLFQLAGLPI